MLQFVAFFRHFPVAVFQLGNLVRHGLFTVQIEKELETLTNQLKRAENALLEELDVDEASAILQLIDETIQSMYEQLEGEVEAGRPASTSPSSCSYID